MKTVLTAFLIHFTVIGWSQTFPVTGQRPSTAFPVCGTETFRQSVVPRGAIGALQVPGCGRYADTNPFWYTFTCYAGGTLGFSITPNNLKDDYDWMLFDITGHDPNDVYSNGSLVVTGNWSGSSGYTGAANGGSSRVECASVPTDNVPTFSRMPTLVAGHKYLLLISHFTQTQSGYSLTFKGGTAVINDPKLPALQSAAVGCDKKMITVVLNKKVRCASLVANGSDFSLSSGLAAIVSATGVNCNDAFDMDTIRLSLSSPLPPGNYSVFSQNGLDDNTLLDDCGSQVAIGEKIDFTIAPPLPTPFDSLAPPACAANKLRFVFDDPIQCSSIAADGSDFIISGTSPVVISGASGECSDGLTRVIDLTLTSPIFSAGSYQVTLKTGSDGNSVINECGQSTPTGESVSFSTKDTVSADFSYEIGFGCINDTIKIHYLPSNGINQWLWNIDPSFTSSLMDLSYITHVFEPRIVQHIVSNGFCSDTATETVHLNNTLRAEFQSPGQVCPKDVFAFTNTSIGNIISWSWNFGDGTGSIQQDPPSHVFPDTWTGKTYTVSLVVKNDLGCYDTLSRDIVKLQSCYITVPNAFTPNGDSKNDYLYPLNAFSASNLEFRIFNRYGQLLFESRDWSRKWDGTISGAPQPTGTYVWTLQYTDGQSGKKFSLRGTSVLVR